MGIDQTVVIEECHIEVELNMDKITEEGYNMIKFIEVILGKEILEEHKIIEVRILQEDIDHNFRSDNYERSRRYRKGQYSGHFRRNDRSSSRSRSGSRVSTNRDRIRCFKCREYVHFAKDCPNISETEKEQAEQIQQMLNLEEDKTALKVLTADTYKYLIRATSEKRL